MPEPSGTPSTTDYDPKDEEALSTYNYDANLERRAVWKLDYTILPVMTMFYLLAFLGSTNIGNARVAGLQKDLGLTDGQYQICVTVFFALYIASGLPSNLLLRRIGPALIMPSLLTIWGIVVTLQGSVTSFSELIVLRVLLGLSIGPMPPGIVLYLSGFYTRRELSLRIAIFFSSASLSGAFSGLLAAAVELMDGIGGRPGWSWIFILEGLFSVCMGLIGFFEVPSTPQDSRSLTHEQKGVIKVRLERDRPPVVPVDTFSIWEILRSLRSPHVIMLSMMTFMDGAMIYGLALFLPSIVEQLGFGATKTQLLSVGPFVAGFFVTLTSAHWSDRYNSRGIPAASMSSLAVLGYALFLGTQDKYTAYGALYLMVPGAYATAPILHAWMANNSEPYYRRATSIALALIAANSGGILTTWGYPTKEGPKFRNKTILNLIFATLVLVGSLINTLYLFRINKRKQNAGYRAKVLAKFRDGDGESKAWMELGDRHPDFQYTL